MLSFYRLRPSIGSCRILLEKVLKRYDIANLWAATGWFLERFQKTFHVSEKVLATMEQRRPRSKQYLERDRRGEILAKRWNLILPKFQSGIAEVSSISNMPRGLFYMVLYAAAHTAAVHRACAGLAHRLAHGDDRGLQQILRVLHPEGRRRHQDAAGSKVHFHSTSMSK